MHNVFLINCAPKNKVPGTESIEKLCFRMRFLKIYRKHVVKENVEKELEKTDSIRDLKIYLKK